MAIMVPKTSSSMLALFLLGSLLLGSYDNNSAVYAFSSSSQPLKKQTTTATTNSNNNNNFEKNVVTSSNDRRAFLSSATATAAATAAALLFVPTQSALAAQQKEYRQGIEVTSFNGLIFNYRGGEFGGLDASSLNEPSISYAEFNEKLKAGQVAFVEFIAPDGDAAYATLKNPDNNESTTSSSTLPPIRIGEGYPIEKHDGFSSPMFCVRAVKNAGVPYKFTVPGLAKYGS